MKTRSQQARERERLVLKQQPTAQIKKENDIHRNGTDSSIACVKLEEEYAKIEDELRNIIKVCEKRSITSRVSYGQSNSQKSVIIGSES